MLLAVLRLLAAVLRLLVSLGSCAAPQQLFFMLFMYVVHPKCSAYRASIIKNLQGKRLQVVFFF